MSEVPITIAISAPGLENLISQFERLDSVLARKPTEFGRAGESITRFGKRITMDGIPTTKRLQEGLEDLSPTIKRMALDFNYALVSVSRSLFWVGLGIMFFFMSLARLNRMMFQIEVAQYGVYRATRALQRAQRDARETILEYGPASQEARDAMERVKDAQMALRMAHERVREASEAQLYAWMMLIYGAVPTVLRTMELIVVFRSLSVAHHIASIKALAHATSLAFLKWGIIGVGIAAAMTAAYIAITAKQMEHATESAKRFEGALGPRSVIGTAKRTIETLKDLREEMVRVGWVPRAPELGQIRPTVSMVTINIFNPQLTRREDIRELRRQLEIVYFRGLRRRSRL